MSYVVVETKPNSSLVSVLCNQNICIHGVFTTKIQAMVYGYMAMIDNALLPENFILINRVCTENNVSVIPLFDIQVWQNARILGSIILGHHLFESMLRNLAAMGVLKQTLRAWRSALERNTIPASLERVTMVRSASQFPDG